MPICDVVSFFDDREKLTFQVSFDGAKRDTVDRFRGKAGVYDSAPGRWLRRSIAESWCRPG